jgi:ABC-2 type transport system permease protein
MAMIVPDPPVPGAASIDVPPARRPGDQVAVVLALPMVVGFLPGTLSDQVNKYLPGPAGLAVTNVRPDPTALGSWTGFGVLCLYAVVALGLAAWLLRGRDV